MLIFQTGGKGSRREQYLFEITHIHTTAYESQILGFAIRIRVLLGTVITVTVHMLGRCIERKLMLVFLPEEVVSQTTAIDNVLGLFGNVGLERFKVELVATPTEFIGSVVFDVQTAELSGTIVSTETEGIHVELTDFRKAVSIHIVWITIAIGLIHSDTIYIVLRHQRSIGSHVLLPSIAIHVRHGRRYLEGIAHRIFGNDIDGTPYGIGAEQGRATATHHFDTFHHIGRNLFQSIHTRKGTDDRTAVDENLRIRTFQSIDTNLRKRTILATVLYTESRLEVE